MGVVGLDQDCWRIELEDVGSPGLARVQVAGRFQADTGLIYRSCVVEPLDFCCCWSVGSGCGPLLQEEPEGRCVGEGFARGRSDT